MIGELTHKQATTLAAFLHELRGDWDRPGIIAELGKARAMAPASDLAIAAVRAASDPNNRTPAVIGMEGAHWRGSAVAPKRTFVRAETCGICSLPRNACELRWAHDHDFESLNHPDRRATASERVAELRQRLGAQQADETQEETA